MRTIGPRLVSWATAIDEATVAQAQRTAALPVIAGHVALMPDAHLGIGATVGSVIPTEGAVIPAAVGVDLGCGMIASRTDLRAEDLPDDLDRLLGPIARRVPAGVGQGHDEPGDPAFEWLRANPAPSERSGKQVRKALTQFGTLGSGNHFVELCLDETDTVWTMLHSGSRGIGNELAQRHIRTARGEADLAGLVLEDPDLAWFTQGTASFDAYIADLHWAQEYARANREAMAAALHDVLAAATRPFRVVHAVNCHHNYCTLEHHHGREVWVTRKGAIRAGLGEWGVIPGSMGARSFVVRGRGNPASFASCSHGAGRAMSRNEARRRFTAADLCAAMGDRVWLTRDAAKLVDEIPAAYKDIDEVMAAQADLVEVAHTLRQVLNYKGT